MPVHSVIDPGNGLVVRWSTAADQERIADLFSHVFRRSADDPPNTRMIAYAQHQMSGHHPLIGPNDIALVEDAQRGIVVAATSVMRQRWEYAGVPLRSAAPSRSPHTKSTATAVWCAPRSI